jgi:ABC-type phosphate transport system ATPase subunit
MTTNILQKLLNEQIKILDTKIQKFKNKEYYTKEEIENHNNEINELQRKINIIYQRSNYHIKSIMEELCELLEKMDNIFNQYNM